MNTVILDFFVLGQPWAFLCKQKIEEGCEGVRKSIYLLLWGKQNIFLFSWKHNQKCNNVAFHVLKAGVQWSNIFPFKFASRGSIAMQWMLVVLKSREVAWVWILAVHVPNFIWHIVLLCWPKNDFFIFQNSNNINYWYSLNFTFQEWTSIVSALANM